MQDDEFEKQMKYIEEMTQMLGDFYKALDHITSGNETPQSLTNFSFPIDVPPVIETTSTPERINEYDVHRVRFQKLYDQLY
jgi:hypothetical protein